MAISNPSLLIIIKAPIRISVSVCLSVRLSDILWEVHIIESESTVNLFNVTVLHHEAPGYRFKETILASVHGGYFREVSQ